jgi:hypothetical protein
MTCWCLVLAFYTGLNTLTVKCLCDVVDILVMSRTKTIMVSVLNEFGVISPTFRQTFFIVTNIQKHSICFDYSWQ